MVPREMARTSSPRHDRDRDRDGRHRVPGRDQPRSSQHHQPRVDAPEDDQQDNDRQRGGQAVGIPEKARRHRAQHDLGAGEPGRQQRVQALPVALRSDPRGQPGREAPPIARIACAATMQPKMASPKPAAPATESRSQPCQSQTITQPATAAVISTTAPRRSENAEPLVAPRRSARA